jgi:hypothetical protein
MLVLRIWDGIPIDIATISRTILSSSLLWQTTRLYAYSSSGLDLKMIVLPREWIILLF